MRGVDFPTITRVLQRTPEVTAAWVFGSASQGVIREGGDLDVGVLFDAKPGVDQLASLRADLQQATGFEDIDVVVLNGASPVLRFEAISGRLVMSADEDRRARFVSRVAREYEEAMATMMRHMPVPSNAAASAPRPASASAGTADAEPLLSVTDLSMFFPIRRGVWSRVVAHVRAVDAVRFDIRRGETVGLVGESGCGKTTVGKCIVRFLKPTGGRIVFDGVDIARLGRRDLMPFRRRIQIVFQDPYSSLNPRMMVGETVSEGMVTHRLVRSRAERDERTREALRRVGLTADMMNRYPHEFSGGQRQRVGLARALSTEPDLVICDEATSALDVSVQAQILNLLRDLQEQMGLSYLFITHDLGVVQYLAHRVVVMYLGRIVERGRTADIFSSPCHPYTRALLAAAPRWDARRGRRTITLAGDVPSPINPPPGCPFHPRCPAVMPHCSSAWPGTTDLGNGHTVHCYLAQDIPIDADWRERVDARMQQEVKRNLKEKQR